MKCIMLNSILKKYPKLFLAYFGYMLILFIFLSVFALYVIRFSDFRFLNKDFDVIESSSYSIRSINDNINTDKSMGQYKGLSHYLDSSRLNLNDTKTQFELINESKYRVCLTLNTDYNFRKNYMLTLDSNNYYRFDSNVKIYLEKKIKEPNFYYECYIVEI